MTPIDVVHRSTPAKAMQHTEESRDGIAAWVLGAGGQAVVTLDDLLVKTPTKWAQVEPGWWVIRGVVGQFFVIEPAVYEGCYDRVVVDYGSDLGLSDDQIRSLRTAAHATDDRRALWEIVDQLAAAALGRKVG